MPSSGTSPAFRPCIIIPVYNHAHAIERVVTGLLPCAVPCVLIDDGSAADCRATLQRLRDAHPGDLTVLTRQQNGGKGAAMATGFAHAAAAGFTHALQIDADGQHDPADAPAFIDAARARPDAVVCGVPIYDNSVPRGRLYGRYITHFWVRIHTFSSAIGDSMCGFRMYPLAATQAVIRDEGVAPRMAFDTDIIVRLFWRGVPVINQPTRVRYPLDGVSHFDMWRDNVRITRMHTRLFFTMLWRRLRQRGRVTPAADRNTGRS